MSSSAGYARRAHHAGSWYSNDGPTLEAELTRNLQAAAQEMQGPQELLPPLRGVISPHAGFSYSGPTAAFAYHPLQKELACGRVKHILVLHPSHHVYLAGCAVSGASVLETPVGNLTVDDELRQEILALGGNKDVWQIMKQSVDEREHSGEMQYPYIAMAMKQHASNNSNIPVLPIMCGSLSTAQEAQYGTLLAPIIARPDVLCVISSDFCHWGSRFQYQPTVKAKAIYEYITELDHQGMQHIEWQQPGAFATYLKQTRNTICGRHAISVWLHAVVHNNNNDKNNNNSNNNNPQDLEIHFVKYAQSSQVRSMNESSVSYASATARQKKI